MLLYCFSRRFEHQSILNATWHDVAWANELTLSGLGASEHAEAACRQFGRDCITELLTGVHRFMLKPLAPTIVLGNADKFFRNYYRGGIVTSGSTGPCEGYIVASGFDGIVPELWYAIFGGSEVILEAAGVAHATLVWDKNQSTAQQVYAAVSWSEEDALLRMLLAHNCVDADAASCLAVCTTRPHFRDGISRTSFLDTRMQTNDASCRYTPLKSPWMFARSIPQ